MFWFTVQAATDKGKSYLTSFITSQHATPSKDYLSRQGAYTQSQQHIAP